MSLFAGTNKWGNTDRLAHFYNYETDGFFKRTVILALGKHDQDFLLRPKKININQMTNWDKRAFIYAASCFPEIERSNWYKAIRNGCNELENYVISWASKIL